MVSLLPMKQKDGHSTTRFTGIDFFRTFECLSSVNGAGTETGVYWFPVDNDLQHLPEWSRTNRWWPGCKLLFLPCFHSGKVVVSSSSWARGQPMVFASPLCLWPCREHFISIICCHAEWRCALPCVESKGYQQLYFISLWVTGHSCSVMPFLKREKKKRGETANYINKDIIYNDW